MSAYDRFLKVSILGRNLALIYCVISMSMASLVIAELEFCLPAIAGGLAMLWSFFYHLPIERPDYNRQSVIELQKSISRLRVHTAISAKYDIIVVFFWLLTLVPLFIKITFNVSIYANETYLSISGLVSFIVLVLMIAVFPRIYKDYDQQLRRSESYLEEIILLEKN